MIKSVKKFPNGKYKIKLTKNFSDWGCYNQVGAYILSMSKRIMNEVLSIAEENNIKVYYGDTDSIQMLKKDFYTIEREFAKKYNRNFQGKYSKKYKKRLHILGNFHPDLEFSKPKGSDMYFPKKHGPISGGTAIFLAKKCYIIELLCWDIEKKEIFTWYHIRMKGVPLNSILLTVKNKNFNNPMELYESLYNGNPHDFDLKEGGLRVRFKFQEGTVKNLKKFTRTILFN